MSFKEKVMEQYNTLSAQKHRLPEGTKDGELTTVGVLYLGFKVALAFLMVACFLTGRYILGFVLLGFVVYELYRLFVGMRLKSI